MYPMMMLTGIKQIIREKALKRITQVRTMIQTGEKAISRNPAHGQKSRKAIHPVHQTIAVPITAVGIPVIQTGIPTGDAFKGGTVFRAFVKRIRHFGLILLGPGGRFRWPTSKKG